MSARDIDDAPTAIRIKAADNVATLTAAAEAGQGVGVVGVAGPQRLVALDDIPRGHKIAVSDIAQGAEIVKYGEPIGEATCAVRAGEWVHVHNCRGLRARRFADI